jgi:hypothetical protein
MHIFEELSWKQFQQLNNISRLPLNEQVKHYNQYLYELSIARQNWIDYQNKGKLLKNIGFLLQEDLFDLEQEDGSKVYITGYA